MSKSESTKHETGKAGHFVKSKSQYRRVLESGTYPEIANARELWSAINQCIKVGHAVIIGATRDGGALCLTILDGDDRWKTYCANEEEVREAAQRMLQDYS